MLCQFGWKTVEIASRAAMENGIGMVSPGIHAHSQLHNHREYQNRPRNLQSGFASRLLRTKYLEKINMVKMAQDSRIALDHVGMGIDEYARVAGLRLVISNL
jgi:hypothetical protein